ncbi:CHRD domain-containing protein [Parachitinimonas caeni]|uniref:CHRD domain-containing protein n=1 Tax=Parachitinimonas caeni TaxID=3031301 RepID=A0ABT7E0X6_9NEIS|nr:CHRD domain-containing protein [Parachitinimonas caeni]MDK2124572.1 CHRD domain-containing protein [Parachitinimonas caeni]
MQKLLPLAALVLVAQMPAEARIYTFVNMPLTGSQAGNPTSSGKGFVNAMYDTATKTLTYHVKFELTPNATATAAHIHGPGDVGVQGLPVKYELTGVPSADNGSFGGTLVISGTDETELLTGKWYVNIHSSQFQSGEIRAQLFENSSSYSGVVYDSSTNTFAIKDIVIPKVGVYDAEFLIQQSNTLGFTVTKAGKTR